ncbi:MULTISPECIES: glycosyltransferase [Bacillus]|nr:MULTISPECIES: glycosyltransferase [Bacillus]KLA17443.1 hypothetical protein B4087_5592 [Bacillus cereus]KMP63661.1 hypothetical protein TU57_12505 [Bacillus cereus]KXX93927.1 hypothetical protein AT274_13620 [Bacillus cereus]MCG3790423.1 glycosyltransferase [Bacillus sp. UTDS19-33BHI26]MDG1597673.1 glycosyltransferase [Bacillus cereus]
MTKENILYVTHSSKKGGAEQSLIHLLNNLDTSKFNIYLVCPKGTEYLNEVMVPFTEINLKLESIKQGNFLNYLKEVLSLKKIIKKSNVKVVHANGWRAPWYVAPMRLLSKSKIIWHHRDKFDSKVYNYFLPLFFNNVICISNFVKGTLSNSVHHKCKVIYNGVDLKHIAETNKINNSNLDHDYFNIGTFGRIVEWKRLESIIYSLKIFKDRNPNILWKFYIVGDISIDGNTEYLDVLKKKVNELNLEAHIVFYGHTSNPLGFMREFDITINFSDREPFGRVIIESLLMKTPVIVADSGGAPEIIRDTLGGIIVPDNDFNELARAIENMHNMEQYEYDNMVERGFKAVYTKFDMSKLVKEVMYIYDDLISK